MRLTIPKVKYLSSGTASGRENVSKSAFESIDVVVLPLDQQRRIASILSAYDDLIENNTHRLKILEEMRRGSIGSGSSTSASPATRRRGWSIRS
jgi:type I restriction enzyme, S subunit